MRLPLSPPVFDYSLLFVSAGAYRLLALLSFCHGILVFCTILLLSLMKFIPASLFAPLQKSDLTFEILPSYTRTTLLSLPFDTFSFLHCIRLRLPDPKSQTLKWKSQPHPDVHKELPSSLFPTFRKPLRPRCPPSPFTLL